MVGKPWHGRKRALTPTERQRRWRANKKHAAKRREAREQAIAARIQTAKAELDGLPLFAVILADPPWRFEPWSRVTGMSRAADNHYPTLTTAEIMALSPPAAPDCVLFLWATAPMLGHAAEPNSEARP